MPKNKGTITRPPRYTGRFLFVQKKREQDAAKLGSYPIEEPEPEPIQETEPIKQSPSDILTNIRKRQYKNTRRGMKKVKSWR